MPMAYIESGPSPPKPEEQADGSASVAPITDTGSGGLPGAKSRAEVGGAGNPEPQQSITLGVVQIMIDSLRRETQTKMNSVVRDLNSKLDRLPTHDQMRKTFRDALLSAFTIALAILGAVYVYLGYGRDQFEAGIQLTTGTINYGLDAKKAYEKHTEELTKVRRVLEVLERRQGSPNEPKGSPPAR